MTGVVVPRGAAYLNTESGLSAPGGFLDRLTAAMDNSAQYQGAMTGLGPALRQSGIPVSAPQGVLSGMLSRLGVGASGAPANSTPSAANSAPMSPMSAPSGQPASIGAPASGSGGGFMPVFANAISSVESGGKYDALGPQTQSGDQALGKYQVMASNVGPWSKEVLGQELTPAQFLANPQAQDAVFQGKFGQYLQKTGNPQDAASMWFTGRPLSQGAGAQDQLGTTGSGYVSKFMAALPGGGGASGSSGGLPAQAMAYAPGGGGSGDAPMPQATASAPQPSQGATLASSNMPGTAGQPAGASQPSGSSPAGSASASPGQVLQALMQDPSTRQLGGQLWQGAQQQGGGSGMPGSMTLPAGMTPEALATMISTPQTQALGLQIWQKGLFPQITSIEPGRAIFRGTQYMGQAPSAPMAAPLDSRIVDPNTGRVIAGASPKLDHAEIGRDAFGQPTYGSFNPQTGTATPFPGGQGSAGGAATDANGQPLAGDAFLGSLPPAIAGQVKAVADGRIKLPTGVGASNPMAQRLRAAVLQYDPSFDQAGVDARFETRADFAKGDAAKTITAGNTALIHLGELSDRIDALGNADTAIPGNNYFNAVKNSTNSTSAAGAPISAFNAIAGKYVEEATKFYRGSGGTESDINRDIANLNANMSPTQLKAAIQAQIPLIQGKVDAMQSRWKQGMGPQAGDYPIMSPQAQSVLNRLGPQAQPGAGPASSSLPMAAPAGSGAPVPQAPAAAAAGGITKTVRGVTYTRGPDGHWYGQ